MKLPIGCEVWVDGVKLADGSAGNTRAPAALDNLSVRWGRSTAVDQPEPSTVTLSVLDRGAGTTRVDRMVLLGSLIVVYAVAPTTRRIVFAGRVTDLGVTYDDGAGGSVMDIVAADLLADLANRYVGSEPWPLETATARANRIGAAISTGGPGVVTIDARPAALSVSRVDVDRQAAADLYRELATSTTGVLWVVVPTSSGTPTPTLRIEDTTTRQSMWNFLKGPDNLWRPYPSPTAGLPISSCAILRSPVKWTRVTADLITRATVRWLDQSTSPDTTERSVGIVDTAAETKFGARGLSVGTILASAADATAAAQLRMAGSQASDAWRAAGLTWDLDRSISDDTDTVNLAVALLDNATRYGKALRVEDLPWWTPAGSGTIGQYVEGGTYRFVGGRWVLALNGSSGLGVGGSMTFQGSPSAVRYQDVAPEVSYLDLLGVTSGAPEPTTRTNLCQTPRPVSGRGWLTTRGFTSGGTGAGTYSFVSSPTPPPGFSGSQTVLRKNWTTASTNPGNIGYLVQDTATQYFGVEPGQKLAIAGYMRRIGSSSTAKTFVTRVTWWTSRDQATATQVGGTTSGTGQADNGVNNWRLVPLTVTVPAGAYGMLVYLDTAATTDAGFGVGDGLDACGLIIERADAVTDYFDGSFTNTSSKTYAWTGTVNQSTSTEVTRYAVAADLAAGAGQPRATADVGLRSHNNAYGFPVPDDTDPYRNTWSAINALGNAVAPKLGTLAVQFLNNQTLNHDANGDAVIDLSAKFTSISAVICSSAGPSAWEPAIYQWVKIAGEAAGRVRIRGLKSYGSDGAVIASNVTHASLIVQGVPK